MSYAELVTASNFSFLRGASHARDLVMQAIALGCEGIGLADRNTVAGVVRAYSALNQMQEKCREETGQTLPFKLAVGARLVFEDGAPDVVAYPANRAGWGRLCRLLTKGNLRGVKGECRLGLDDLLNNAGDLLLILMPGDPEACEKPLRRLADCAAGSLWLGATMHRQGTDRRRLARLHAIAQRTGVPLIATNDVLYHDPDQRPLQDILTCIRQGLKIDTAGRRLEANAERHLKSPQEMARLFRDRPEAIEETGHLMARMEFSLGQLHYDYPDEPVPPGKTPQGHLEDLVRQRAAMRYPHGTPQKVARLLEEELALIEELDYAREAAQIRLYRVMLAGEPEVHVPEPVEGYCTPRLLTMTWLNGRPLMERIKEDPPQEVRDRLALNLFKAWYVPLYRYGIIHGDPHMGNYQARADDGLNLLDFGCIRVFEARFIRGVIDLYEAMRDKDIDKAHHAYTVWGFKDLTHEKMAVLNLWAEFLYEPLMEDRPRRIQESDDPQFGRRVAMQVHAGLKRIGGVKPPREFVLMDRAAIGLGSVFLHLKAEINWYRMFHELIADFDAKALARRQAKALKIAQVPEAA